MGVQLAEDQAALLYDCSIEVEEKALEDVTEVRRDIYTQSTLVPLYKH
jgi:hypothetical protein